MKALLIAITAILISPSSHAVRLQSEGAQEFHVVRAQASGYSEHSQTWDPAMAYLKLVIPPGCVATGTPLTADITYRRVGGLIIHHHTSFDIPKGSSGVVERSVHLGVYPNSTTWDLNYSTVATEQPFLICTTGNPRLASIGIRPDPFVQYLSISELPLREGRRTVPVTVDLPPRLDFTESSTRQQIYSTVAAASGYHVEVSQGGKPLSKVVLRHENGTDLTELDYAPPYLMWKDPPATPGVYSGTVTVTLVID